MKLSKLPKAMKARQPSFFRSVATPSDIAGKNWMRLIEIINPHFS
jgi:hypothetical protein